MERYTIVVDWNDMPIGFKSWLLHLKHDEGMEISTWSNEYNDATTGLGFDIEEDNYEDNKIYKEMIEKFCNAKRKTRLKRWTLLDHVKKHGIRHVEE